MVALGRERRTPRNLLELAKGVKALGASTRAITEGWRATRRPAARVEAPDWRDPREGSRPGGIAAQSLLAQTCFT